MNLSSTLDAERKITLVGLAKNTGKTVAMKTLFSELTARGETLGVTSIGRDGEAHDALNADIRKPRIWLSERSLVATTEGLVAKSGLPIQTLRKTEHRTPLGVVVIGRVLRDGHLEVAGPSAVEDVGEVSDLMLELGAHRVLIDGAINRRAAAAPTVSDAVIVSTGAVLGEDLAEIAATTREAVGLLRLEPLSDPRIASLLEGVASPVVITTEGEILPLNPLISLTGVEPARDLATLRRAEYVVVQTALLASFIQSVLVALKGRAPTFVAKDSAKVFFDVRNLEHLEKHGVRIRVLRASRVVALTVNPVAPESHRFPPGELLAAIREALPDLPVFDVLDPDDPGGFLQPSPAR